MVRDRFKQVSIDAMPLINRGEGSSFKKQFLDWISLLGHYAVDNKQDDSVLRQSLIQAGFRHPKGVAIFFGLRFLLALLLPVFYLLANMMHGVMNQGNLLYCFVLAGARFYTGPYLLKIITRRRQDRIDKALPDVLDLLIVCMEAGLCLQATINRVSDEVKERAAEKRGVRAQGFRVPAGQVTRISRPVIVHVRPQGYEHFAVLKGIRGGRAYLADPSFGNVRMPLYRFFEMGAEGNRRGIVFAVEPKDGRWPAASLLGAPPGRGPPLEALAALELAEAGKLYPLPIQHFAPGR